MSKTRKGAQFARKALSVLMLIMLICSIFGTTIYAADESTGPADTTAAESGENESAPKEQGTLSELKCEELAKVIAAAGVNKNSDIRTTPRDRLTAAYLQNDIEAAREAIKAANMSLKEKNRVTGVEYDKINMADVEALINEMKTDVSLEKPHGLFATIQMAAGSVLHWMTRIVGGNYVLGLLVFAVVMEILLLPVGIKQQKNSIKQAKLQPKERAIRKKYAGRDDKVTQQKVAMEIQQMYQNEGFNPASGCLPMVLQLVVVLILYQVVINPLMYVMHFSGDMSNALFTFANASEAAGGLNVGMNPGRGTIEIASIIKETGPEFYKGLSEFLYFSNGSEIVEALQGAQFPNFKLFGLNLGIVPSIMDPSWLWVIPVLTFVVYFGSMKLTRKMTYQPAGADAATGCSNNIMDITMPLFSVYICFVVPAALGVYWIFKSILSTLSRFILTKTMPVPTFTEDEYKAVEKEMFKGKPAVSERVTPSGKVVRSLHHIDDEDFEDTREAALARKEKLKEQEEEEQKALEEKEKRKSESTLIKNDDDRPQLSMREMKEKLRKSKQQKAEEKKQAEKQKNAVADNTQDSTEKDAEPVDKEDKSGEKDGKNNNNN